MNTKQTHPGQNLEPAQAQPADVMRESALRDAKAKRWEGWDWKAYQTSIVRQNYKIRDAQRLVDALEKIRDEWEHNLTEPLAEAMNAITQWEVGAK